MIENQLRPLADEFELSHYVKIYFFNNYKLTVLRTVTSKPQRTFFKLLNFQIRNFRLSFYSYVQHKLCHFLTLIFVFSTGQDNIWPPIFRFFCAWRRNIKSICSIYNIITLNIVINCTSIFKKRRESTSPCCFNTGFLNLGTADIWTR